jgi:hypothetical protein
MDGNKENTEISAGRTRGHSMLSTLKATTTEHRGHPGMPFEHADEVNGQGGSQNTGLSFGKRPFLDVMQGRVASGGGVSALTEALHAEGELCEMAEIDHC